MTSLLILLGLLIRLAIPVAFTILLVLLMNWLDKRWQDESEDKQSQAIQLPVHNSRCWEVNKCSDEKKKTCPAYKHPETPCWQVFRDKNGLLGRPCLGCEVFRQAPIPVISSGIN